jgi:hypothetical protein
MRSKVYYIRIFIGKVTLTLFYVKQGCPAAFFFWQRTTNATVDRTWKNNKNCCTQPPKCL